MKDYQKTDEKRNNRIYKLKLKGYSNADIALKVQITGERVRQILTKFPPVDNSEEKTA